MTVQMFVYLNKQSIVKVVSEYFGVKKYCGFKIKVSNKNYNRATGMMVCGYYDVQANTIYVNESMWDISSDYEKFDLIVHEIVHVYQHKYSLCDISYEGSYYNRPQEIHCRKHTEAILEDLNVFEDNDSILNLIEEA